MVQQIAASGTARRTFVREPGRSLQDVVPRDRLQEITYSRDALKTLSRMTADAAHLIRGKIEHNMRQSLRA